MQGTVLISDSTLQISDFGNARSSADLLWSVLPDDVSALQIISFKDAQIWRIRIKEEMQIMKKLSILSKNNFLQQKQNLRWK